MLYSFSAIRERSGRAINPAAASPVFWKRASKADFLGPAGALAARRWSAFVNVRAPILREEVMQKILVVPAVPEEGTFMVQQLN